MDHTPVIFSRKNRRYGGEHYVVAHPPLLKCDYPISQFTLCDYSSSSGSKDMVNHILSHAAKAKVRKVYICKCKGTFTRLAPKGKCTHSSRISRQPGEHDLLRELRASLENIRKHCTQQAVRDAVAALRVANVAFGYSQFQPAHRQTRAPRCITPPDSVYTPAEHVLECEPTLPLSAEWTLPSPLGMAYSPAEHEREPAPPTYPFTTGWSYGSTLS